jgi:hypothetical protein
MVGLRPIRSASIPYGMARRIPDQVSIITSLIDSTYAAILVTPSKSSPYPFTIATSP